MKRLLAFVTAAIIFAMNMTAFFDVSAEDYNYGNMTDTFVQNDITVEGTNSFGNMLAAELSAKQNEQAENNGYNVFSVDIENAVAYVDYETVEDSILVLGIYSDDVGSELVTTAYTDVYSSESTAEIMLDSSKLPQYYTVKAYLINPQNMRPLCTVFECPTYTKEMQEFLAKTTEDFDADRVLNLDNSKDNNFAVYSDDTVLAETSGEVNKIISADYENQIYVIGNPDSNITALKAGDIFAHEYNETELIIAKIKTISSSADGKTVTISGEEAALEDVFDYVKIDESGNTDNCEIDTSYTDEELTYTGRSSVFSDSRISSSGSYGKSFNFELNADVPAEDNSSKISIKGGIELAVTASYKFYYDVDMNPFDKDPFYIEFVNEQKLGFNVSISGKGLVYEKKIPEITLWSNGILKCEINSKFVVEASVELELNAVTTKKSGFSYDSDTGKWKDISSAPKTESEVELEGKIYIGLKSDISLKIVVLKKDFASVGFYVDFGVEFTAKPNLPSVESLSDIKHDCGLCLDGDINFNASASVKLNVFFGTVSTSWNIASTNVKIADFYISDIDGFGWGECPHLKHRLSVIISDTLGYTVENVEIMCGSIEYMTGKDGKAELYLPNGDFEITATCAGYKMLVKRITMRNTAMEINLCMSKKSDIQGGLTDLPSGKVKQIELYEAQSAAVMDNGDLYVWGSHNIWQYGDGTETKSAVPIKLLSNVEYVSLCSVSGAALTKNGDLYGWGHAYRFTVPYKILSNVASVSLGYDHGAAITQNGDLYIWGYDGFGSLNSKNNYGKLGIAIEIDDNDVPIKVLENVVSVSLGSVYSSAITANGELYTWGNNQYGKLGDGTNEDRKTPIMVMDNVASVCLGQSHSAAIKTNGELYMWGRNNLGQLGDGTTVNKFLPQKIFDNVAFVSVGEDHSAAITNNGDLYMWGSNQYFQLSDKVSGTYTTIPQKIMSDVASVDLGSEHSAVIMKNGDIYTWGDNKYGQLGNGLSGGDDIYYTDGIDSKIPIKVELSPSNNTNSVSLYSVPSLMTTNTVKAFTGLIPNEVYNIYGMKTRNTDTPFNADNLLYISQAISDSTGALTFDYLPDEECPNPEIFVKAMRSFDVPNAQFNYAEIENGTATLKWDPVLGASNYTVYSVRNGVYIKEADVTGLEYVVSGLMENTEYGFMVQSWVNGEYSVLEKNDIVYLVSEKTYTLGDINGDGKINNRDLTALRRYLAGLESTISPAGDLNGDGKVNNRDLTKLRRILAGME